MTTKKKCYYLPILSLKGSRLGAALRPQVASVFSTFFLKKKC